MIVYLSANSCMPLLLNLDFVSPALCPRTHKYVKSQALVAFLMCCSVFSLLRFSRHSSLVELLSPWKLSNYTDQGYYIDTLPSGPADPGGTLRRAANWHPRRSFFFQQFGAHRRHQMKSTAFLHLAQQARQVCPFHKIPVLPFPYLIYTRREKWQVQTKGGTFQVKVLVIGY